MLEAQDDSTHIKSSQTSLKLVSDTSVVVGDDNVPSIYQPSTSELNFAEMLEAQDDSTHIKSSQTSLKLVSDTSVVVGDDNVPKMPQQCALRAAMAKQSRTSL